MAIGSLDKAGRLAQLRDYARVQVWSGYHDADSVYAEVLEAVADEEPDPAEAHRLTEAYIAEATRQLEAASARWPAVTSFERFQRALADLEAADIVVRQACTDHWQAEEVLRARREQGEMPWGIAYFTDSDVWHAVEHGMLEVNLWHGTSANTAPGDSLLEFVHATFAAHGLDSTFDEGRIELTLPWQRRP